jgi:osmotically-inducible protein OsmY
MMRDRQHETSTYADRGNRHTEREHPGIQRYRGDTGNVGNTPEGNRTNEGIYATHRGKGPRNYKRSDQRIREIVCDLLCDDPYLDASNIEIEVKNGVVIMTGSVADRFVKGLAEDLAKNVLGVMNVQSRIHVNEEGMHLQEQERAMPYIV